MIVFFFIYLLNDFLFADLNFIPLAFDIHTIIKRWLFIWTQIVLIVEFIYHLKMIPSTSSGWISSGNHRASDKLLRWDSKAGSTKVYKNWHSNEQMRQINFWRLIVCHVVSLREQTPRVSERKALILNSKLRDERNVVATQTNLSNKFFK